VDNEAELAEALGIAERAPEVTAEVVEGETTEGPDAQIAPIFAILIGASVIAAAKFVNDVVHSWRDKGVVVDLRPDAPDTVYKDPDLRAGWVVVVLADGKVTVEVKPAREDAWERLLAELLDGAFESVKSVADAAKKALGDDAVKSDDDGETQA